MKILAINGSPRPDGNTFHALQTVLGEVAAAGIATEILHIGHQAVRGCTACGGCGANRDRRCVLPGEQVNGWIEKMAAADGLILASPVYFSGVAGTMKSFLDRAFYVSAANGNFFRQKVGAALAVVRRAGGMPTLAGLKHYLEISEMVVANGNYWTVAYGRTAGEVQHDSEGQQTLQTLGRNIAWLVKTLAAGRAAAPAAVNKIATNFIR